jgi:putative zinc finger/helix-turn-helix YgiT family protein
MRRNNNGSNTRVFECPNCGSSKVETRKITDRFQYGSGAKAVSLEALIPFRRCADCGFEFTDSEAEDIRHEAICRHLGVMTPAEIVALRNKYRLTRAQFAEKTRIGEASLARWETGELIQNPANDGYMYLLSFPDNFKRLEKRYQAQQTGRRALPSIDWLKETFRGLVSEAIPEKLKEADAFRL